MAETKEQILMTALRLFARDGYEAVSVSDIAGELGITKGALYKHYKNKRDIFDSILRRMERRDAEQAGEHALPGDSAEKMADAYRNASVDDMIAFSKGMFRYWTQDAFAAQFRRMLTLEQFRSPEMGELYQQYLAAGPVDYMANLFAGLGLTEPEREAAEFYSPMFLLYSVYDGTEDRGAVLSMLDGIMERARRHLKQRMKRGENMENIIIRRETESEHRAVENLVRESFWNVYRPGCLEHYVLHRLRDDPAFVPELDFVMEKDGRLIGQNMFMRAVIKADDGRDIPIMTMGPICVAPECKRQGYGKILLDYSLEQAAALGCGALCFEGNIDFYGKSGFTFASSFGIRYHDLPADADASFFLCKELIPGYLSGITGEYAPPEGYYAADQNPEDFEVFDAQFPPKEKLRLPGQLF
jgi:Predicted acetyltransferase